MMRLCVAALLLSGVGAGMGESAAAAGAPAGEDLTPLQAGLDYHSFANVEQFRVTHIELDLRVIFEWKALDGVVGLEIKRLDPRATQLVLDTRGLDVRDVSQKATDLVGAAAKSEPVWVGRPFHFEKADPILGSALVIDLPPSRKQTEFIRIDYRTSPDAPGLQWLTEKQTAGKHKPFMYSNSESIGARSWIPLQDTPQVRVTYVARIHTPHDLRAVMSAQNDPDAKRNGEYSFTMPQAIPSYLIALAVGDIGFEPTGPRTGVYAEKPILKAAAKEFADTEAMIETSEKMFGAYRWGRYDILVMPPSFPEGGMENPRLSFISPTVIAGDKSLVSVIAHELAHSWSGNLVTNASWRDLWLNEGFTDYMENRIMNAVYGQERASMELVLGLRALRDGMAKLKPKDQVLAIDLRNRDPDEVFTQIPYEKGRLFLNFLAAKFGQERFDEFLRGYFDHFAFKSISTEQFLGYLQENLLDKFPGIVTREAVNTWVTGPGIPADAVLPTTNAFEVVDQVRTAWLAGTPAKALATQGWVTQQWLYFLDNMPPLLSSKQLADLDSAFGFTRTPNAEIARSWLLIGIRDSYQPSFVRLQDYLKTIGRGKLIKPLYVELMKSPAGAAVAKSAFAAARGGYDIRVAADLDAIVNPPDEDAAKE